MQWLYKLIAPLFTAGASIFFLLKNLKKRYTSLKKYYQIIVVLTGAIESIETSTGIMPDTMVMVSKAVKGLVSRFLSKEDREELDRILYEKGYKKKEIAS